ncbi:MAG: hypothetical protein MRERV_72c001 [Mycoplasmataceae bacterium RV_VA103A]|nr:MAG: hypothetical protein MRERV_72c001 [Mycoplasmataceae bacterium RV_VA103A]
MNKATLIKKEILPNNFKLTFKNQTNTQFLILHEEHKELYTQLELNQEYFYIWKKGKKNYGFLNPHSIKKNTKETSNLIEKPSKEQIKTPPQGFFIQHLIKDLRLKELTKKEFLAKMENLKNKLKRTNNQSDNLNLTLKWMKEFITTLYLKHDQLEENIKDNYTEQEQKEREFLAEIGAMFLQDWIHFQDKRKSKYNQKYWLTYLENEQK